MLRICTSFIFNRNLSPKLIIIFIISFQTTYYILLIFFLIINVNFHNGAPFTYQAGLNRQRTLNILNKNLDFKASYLSIIIYSKMFNLLWICTELFINSPWKTYWLLKFLLSILRTISERKLKVLLFWKVLRRTVCITTIGSILLSVDY